MSWIEWISMLKTSVHSTHCMIAQREIASTCSIRATIEKLASSFHSSFRRNSFSQSCNNEGSPCGRWYKMIIISLAGLMAVYSTCFDINRYTITHTCLRLLVMSLLCTSVDVLRISSLPQCIHLLSITQSSVIIYRTQPFVESTY